MTTTLLTLRRLALGLLLLAAVPARAADAPAKAPARSAEPKDAKKPLTPNDLPKMEPNEEVEDLILRGADPLPISTLVDETVDDILSDLARLDTAQLSPMAIRAVNISPNLKANFATDLEARLTAALAQGTEIKQVACANCRALRSRVEHGEWVVTLGPVSNKDLAQLGESIGVKTFLEIDFVYWSGTNVVRTNARIVRASDSAILWSESYQSNSTTAALERGHERAKSRLERRAELQRLIDGRPYYGQAASLGFAVIGYKKPSAGSLTGLLGGYRIYEKFGPDKRSLFGLSLEGYFHIGQEQTLMGGFVGGTYLYELSHKSLVLPELKVGASAGGFLVGTEGNTFYVEAIAQMMMKFRFGVEASLLYMVPAKYLQYDLGGLGARVRLVFQW